jgi:P2 family phage contractile tail tube protein
MYPNILHNFAFWANNGSKLGICDTVKLPKLEYLKDDHIGGGMTGKVEIKFAAHDIIKVEAHLITWEPDLVQLFSGDPMKEHEFQFRGALTSEASSGFVPAVCFVKGFCEVEPEEWKVAAKTGKTLPITCSYLHLTHDNKSLLKLEPKTATWEVGGKSTLPGLKAALGY